MPSSGLSALCDGVQSCEASFEKIPLAQPTVGPFLRLSVSACRDHAYNSRRYENKTRGSCPFSCSNCTG
jgi:hypothetical protein